MPAYQAATQTNHTR